MSETLLLNGRIATLDLDCASATPAAIESALFAAIGDGCKIMVWRIPNALTIDRD